MSPRKSNPFLSTAAAAAALGITVSQFTRLAAKLGVVHDDEYENPRYRSAAPAKLWSKTKIHGLRRRKAVKGLIAACQARTAKRAATEATALRELLARVDARARQSAVLLSELGTLSTDALVSRALECMHALNRQAKYLRAAGRAATQPIYDLKDVLLGAMIRAGRAQVYAFETTRVSRQMFCRGCGRDWVGDSYCYECEDDTGEATVETVRWFVVDCGGGYRFHSPSLPEDLARLANSIEPHDPNQPLREIPDLGLTEEAMRATITAATHRLSDVAVAWTPSLLDLAQDAIRC